MARKFLNRAKVATSTTGIGSVTLDSAVSGFQTFAAAGGIDGDEIEYVIEDGTDWEIGVGVLSTTATVLSRTLVDSSTGAILNLSGSATVFAGLVAKSGVTQTERKAIAVAMTIAQ